ncbi:hypothetical protein ACPC54_10625 [Kitasatospora sp. NPDC094028]
MARRGGELEAFIAFVGGVLAAGLAGLAMAGVGVPVRPLKAAVAVTLGAVWLTVTTTVYLRLKPRTD